MATLLAAGDLTLTERLASASNAVFRATCRDAGGAMVDCVYKPAAGERPLWDFPQSVLGRHEVAAYEVSEALGWGIVPTTVWREDGPAGPGVVQQWVDAPVTDDVDVVAPEQVEPGWLPILRGADAQDRDVVLVTRDSERLADIAAFDVVINNSDRKAGHLLGSGVAIMGIDHGVAFHHEWKVRTVLWGFAHRPLTERRLTDLRRLAEAVDDGRVQLAGIPSAGRAALLDRIAALLDDGVFPAPRPGWPVVPWPLW